MMLCSGKGVPLSPMKPGFDSSNAHFSFLTFILTNNTVKKCKKQV